MWHGTRTCFCRDTDCRSRHYLIERGLIGKNDPMPADCPSRPAKITPTTNCVTLWGQYPGHPWEIGEDVLPQKYYREKDWVRGTYLHPEQRSEKDIERLTIGENP